MKEYISYLDDDGKRISGYFEIVEMTQNYIKIESNRNIILIPYQRVLKIKLKGGNKI